MSIRICYGTSTKRGIAGFKHVSATEDASYSEDFAEATLEATLEAILGSPRLACWGLEGGKGMSRSVMVPYGTSQGENTREKQAL